MSSLDAAVLGIEDPRVWPTVPSADAGVARLHAFAAAGLDAGTSRDEDARRDQTLQGLLHLMRAGDGSCLAGVLADAPSLPVARYLWRLLETLETQTAASTGALSTLLFAIPAVVVAGLAEEGARATLPGLLRQREALAQLLREHRALGGCETFALSGSLAGADAIDLPRLPALVAAVSLGDGPCAAPLAPLDLPVADCDLQGAGERVFLRFVVGAALTAPGVDPLRANDVGTWGMPFSKMLGVGLAVSGIPVLALPRPPQCLVAALRTGRAAQREVGAQIFASNAIRKLRANVGEPTAIISAHRAADAIGGGELRVSLSSPFEPRDAEGFRCPVYPYETVQTVAAMLVSLLVDCRVTDIRIEPGVHADVDASTGLRLLFKDAGSSDSAALH